MKYPCSGAPERVEIAVLDAFRKHHRARRLRRAVVAVIATGAAAACAMLFIRVPEASGPPACAAVYPAPPAIAFTTPKTVQHRRVALAPAEPVHKPTAKPPGDRLAMTDFVPLLYGDYSMVQESATIVRVELPRSALRLAGFNVAEERANDRVQADVMLGADGLAHAVRFVAYRE
jgi:hypothetical protein